MKIAVIGSGISGLSSAYFLSKKYKVDLYEKDDHFGGHSLTFDIKEGDKIVPVDLGFIVFNKTTYPNLVKFFNELSVPYEKSDMSFSVSINNSNVEYSGSGLGGIFANKLNLFNFKFLYMIREIISFYKTAPKLLESKILIWASENRPRPPSRVVLPFGLNSRRWSDTRRGSCVDLLNTSVFHGGASGTIMVQRSTCGSHDLWVLGEARLHGSHFCVMTDGVAWHGSLRMGAADRKGTSNSLVASLSASQS